MKKRILSWMFVFALVIVFVAQPQYVMPVHAAQPDTRLIPTVPVTSVAIACSSVNVGNKSYPLNQFVTGVVFDCINNIEIDGILNYDQAGRITDAISGFDYSYKYYHYEYDDHSYPIKLTIKEDYASNSNNYITTYTYVNKYDSTGRLINQKVTLTAGKNTQVSTYEYTYKDNQIIKNMYEKSQLVDAYIYTYDENQRLYAIFYGADYSDLENLLIQSDALGRIQTGIGFYYDNTTSITYDEKGNLASITCMDGTPTPPVEYFSYSPEGILTNVVYNLYGEITTTSIMINNAAITTPPTMATTTTSTTTTIAEPYKDVYEAFLKTQKDKYMKFNLAYVNEDDTPDLLLFNYPTHAGGVYVYSVKNGQLVNFGTWSEWGRISFIPRCDYVSNKITNQGGTDTFYYHLLPTGFETITANQYKSNIRKYDESTRVTYDYDTEKYNISKANIEKVFSQYP